MDMVFNCQVQDGDDMRVRNNLDGTVDFSCSDSVFPHNKPSQTANVVLSRMQVQKLVAGLMAYLREDG